MLSVSRQRPAVPPASIIGQEVLRLLTVVAPNVRDRGVLCILRLTLLKYHIHIGVVSEILGSKWFLRPVKLELFILFWRLVF